MNDAELEQLLKTAQIPERPPTYWQQFPKTVAARIRWQGRRVATADTASSLKLTRATVRWAFGVASVCIIIGLGISFWRGLVANEASIQLAQAKKYFHEIETLFPNQVRAIVFDDRGAHLLQSGLVALLQVLQARFERVAHLLSLIHI